MPEKPRWDERPAYVFAERDRLRLLAADLVRLSDVVAAAFDELYDASLSPSKEGEEVHVRRAGWVGTDPTSSVATSSKHRQMRWRVRNVARTLRRVRPLLERAENEIVEAFAETDPEMRARLERLRELERGIAEDEAARTG